MAIVRPSPVPAGKESCASVQTAQLVPTPPRSVLPARHGNCASHVSCPSSMATDAPAPPASKQHPVDGWGAAEVTWWDTESGSCPRSLSCAVNHTLPRLLPPNGLLPAASNRTRSFYVTSGHSSPDELTAW